MNNERTDPIQFANDNCDTMDSVKSQPSREDLLWKIELLKQQVKEQQRELEERDCLIKRQQNEETTPLSKQMKAKKTWQKDTTSLCKQEVTDTTLSRVERLEVGSASGSIHQYHRNGIQRQVTMLESTIFEKNMALQVAESRIKTLEAEIIHLQSLLRGQGQVTATTQRQMKEIIDEDELAEQFLKAISTANHNFAPLSQSSDSEPSCNDSVEGIMSVLSNYKVEDGNNPADMYDLLELMGEGNFGKVMKCRNKETREIVAVKAIKMCENVDYVVAKELHMLDKVSVLDPDADNIIRFNKYFKSADGHHYMEFELLDLSVDNHMKRRRAKFSLNEIRPMAKDLLISLKGLQSVGVMHTDVKPDNIMYVDQKNKPFRVKLIDFGVAIPKDRAQVGTIMQPLGYRAPEVTLGLPLTEAVDMWSLGCCLLEWYLSTLPFPCYSPYDHIQMITHLMGVPDGELIKQAMYGNDYFVQEGSEWRLKGVSEYKQTTGVTPIMDWYPLEVFKDLEDVIRNCHQNRLGPDIEYRTFLDLLQKMFHLDPDKRITPAEALSHPFITMSSRTETLSTSTQGMKEMPENANEESESSTKQSSQMYSPENSARFTEEGLETQNTVKPRRVSINDRSSISEHSSYDSVEGIMSLPSEYKVEDSNDPADMYDLLELMGEGNFGKVMKCRNKETREIVAVKAIKMCENVDYVVAKELYMLDKVSALDPDADNIIRFNKYFKSADGHHYMEFELLDLSVDNLMKRRRAPFSLNEIRPMAKDLLISLKGLQSVGVMHTDVKPDNIMYVDQQNKPFRVKLIDFGVAIPKDRAQVGTIMQPLGYRAPEVTLGLPLTEAVDMWSLGCCLLEWYLSTLPFPCYSPYDHIQMITHLMGVPDGELIKQAMYGNDYFVQEGSEWRLKGVSEYKQTTGVTPIMDWYPLEVFKDLEDVIRNCHQNRLGPDIEYRTFLDLLQKMFHLNPDNRITPAEALSHPFITMSSRTETLSTSTQGMKEMPENASEESESSTKQSSQMYSPENSVRFTEEGLETQNTVKPRRVSLNDTSSISEHSCYDSVEGIMLLPSDYKVEDGNDPADTYDLLELMGEGNFGKVMKCLNKETREIVAVKAIKMCENVDYVVAKELYMLNKVSALDPDADNIIRFNKYFKSADGHHYMEFELLDLSVDNLMKRRRAPFSLNEIRPMAKDLLISLKGLQSVGVMHTDVKPDNIMYVDQQNKPFRVKLIDFGVAIPKDRAQVGTIMQPLGYRAPEVTLGLPLTEAVDMWSLGCCLLEWYLSTLPFPCYSPYDHIQMITHLMGVPDGELIKQAMYGNDYFVQEGPGWRLKGVSEYEQTTGVTPIMDWYPLEVFKDLEDVILNCHQNRPGPDIEYRTFLDLLLKMFHLDPDKRITPAEALSHPFITMSSITVMPSTSTQGIEKTPENANKMSESSTKQSSQISSPENSVRFIEKCSETQSSVKPSRVSMTFLDLLQKMCNADPDKRITPGEAPSHPVITVSSRTETPSTNTQGINETPDANKESDFTSRWSKRSDGQAALSLRPVEEHQRPGSPVTIRPASAQHDCQVLQSPEVTTTGLNMTTISRTPETGTGESEVVVRHFPTLSRNSEGPFRLIVDNQAAESLKPAGHHRKSQALQSSKISPKSHSLTTNEESETSISHSLSQGKSPQMSVRLTEEESSVESRKDIQCIKLAQDSSSASISMPTSINGISEGETSKNGKTANQQPSSVEVTTMLKPFPGCKVTTTAWQNPSGVRRRTTCIRLLQGPTLISGISDKHKDTVENRNTSDKQFSDVEVTTLRVAFPGCEVTTTAQQHHFGIRRTTCKIIH